MIDAVIGATVSGILALCFALGAALMLAGGAVVVFQGLRRITRVALRRQVSPDDPCTASVPLAAVVRPAQY